MANPVLSFTVNVTGIDRLRDKLQRLSADGLRAAAAKALTDTAFSLRRAMQDEMREVFDRPTPYILQSVRVEPATPERLEATVAPTYGGGKGVDPQRVLKAQVDGGIRADKRSEVALRRAGLLPAGFQTAIPRVPYPGSDDGRGNLKGGFVVRLLSYFQAMGEQGYRANMTAKRKAQLARRNVTPAGYKTIGGVVFFVAYGRLRGAPTRHLAPGIWAKSGIHGSNLRPVLMFVRRGLYNRRLDMRQVAQRGRVEVTLERRMVYRIRAALGE